HVEILPRHPDQHQIRKRLLIIRILLKDRLIDLRGLVEVSERLQRDRLTELRVAVRRIELQTALEAKESALGVFLAQVADTEPEVRVDVVRLQRTGLVEGLRRVLPEAAALQAYSEVEPSHRVLRLDLNQGAIALGGLVESSELEMDVPHGTIDLGRRLVGCDGALQLPQRLLAFSRKMQGDGARQVALRSAFIVRFELYCPQGLDLRGCAHGDGAH